MIRHFVVVSSAAAVLTVQACGVDAPARHYGFITRLGVDTVAVERVTRHGNRVSVDDVDRFPRVRRRHTEIQLRPDGSIRHLSMDIDTPSEPANEQERHVEADVTSDAVHITKHDSSGTVRRDFNAKNAIVVAHVPQMYSLYELYFEAAQKHDTARRGDDTVHLRQFYIDREFDRFSMHNATVRLMRGGKAEIWHDWLSGIGEATLDSSGHLLSYSGARTTYQVDVQRVSEVPDVQAIGARFAALEAKNGGAKELSVRDTVVATVGGATFTIDYARPLARGRVLVGGIVPYDRVWRTGANAATQFTTTSPIRLAGMSVPAGRYTLWTVPRRSGVVDLIVNKQIGQWGTEYNGALNLAMAPMNVDTSASPTEEFTIAIVDDGARHGRLTMAWGPFHWTAPIVVNAVSAKTDNRDNRHRAFGERP